MADAGVPEAIVQESPDGGQVITVRAGEMSDAEVDQIQAGRSPRPATPSC